MVGHLLTRTSYVYCYSLEDVHLFENFFPIHRAEKGVLLTKMIPLKRTIIAFKNPKQPMF